jgi:hypothetical protein
MSYLLLTYEVAINYDILTTITPNWWLWHQLITNVKIFAKENSNNILVKKMKNVLKWYIHNQLIIQQTCVEVAHVL